MSETNKVTIFPVFFHSVTSQSHVFKKLGIRQQEQSWQTEIAPDYGLA